jgi:hypothetical protein
VANILGVNFSGFIAWWLWRTIYLLKLPRFEKKVLVALDWTLDVLFSKDLVHFRTARPSSLSLGEEEPEKKVWDLCDSTIKAFTATPMAAAGANQPPSPSWHLVHPSPALQSPYPLAHTCDTTSTSRL